MHGGYQEFSKQIARKCLTVFLNQKWWPLDIFRIENSRKCLVAAMSFLDRFFRKYLVTSKHFLD
jgi:hypothetical protein